MFLKILFLTVQMLSDQFFCKRLNDEIVTVKRVGERQHKEVGGRKQRQRGVRTRGERGSKSIKNVKTGK